MGCKCKKCCEEKPCAPCNNECEPPCEKKCDFTCDEILLRIDTIFKNTIKKTVDGVTDIKTHDQLVSFLYAKDFTQFVGLDVFSEAYAEIFLLLNLLCSCKPICYCECKNVIDSILSINDVTRNAKIDILSLFKTSAPEDANTDPFYNPTYNFVAYENLDNDTRVFPTDPTASPLIDVPASWGVQRILKQVIVGQTTDIVEFMEFALELFMITHHYIIVSFLCDKKVKCAVEEYLCDFLSLFESFTGQPLQRNAHNSSGRIQNNTRQQNNHAKQIASKLFYPNADNLSTFKTNVKSQLNDKFDILMKKLSQ